MLFRMAMGIWRDLGWSDPATRLVERIVAAVGARDFPALRPLLADDIALVDSMGEAVRGKDAVVLLLERLVAYDPEFQIHIEDMTLYEDYVLLTGSTTGTHHQSAQRTLWKLLLRDGRVAEWRSYSNERPQPFVKLLMNGEPKAVA